MLSALVRHPPSRLADQPENGATPFSYAWTRVRDAVTHNSGGPEARAALVANRWLLFFVLAFVPGFGGCKSGSNVIAGSISVTEPSGATSGQLSSLSAGSTVQVNMTPVGDKSNDGVNWTVTCGGSPVTGSITGGACGTFVPTHTPDGVASMFTAPSIIPIGNTVTITAAVASNPSASSSVTLPVVAPSLSISFVSPPTSIDLGQKVIFQVRLLNGTGGDNIQWAASCGSSPCGSFNPSVTYNGESGSYTAPTSMPSSGNTIQISAALESNAMISASTSLAILPVSISLTPTTYNVQTSGTASFTATLSNDALAEGADWTVNCNSPGNCGSISSHTASGIAAVYNAPSSIPNGGTVTITAASTTQATQSATAAVTVTATAPISIALTAAPPATLAAGASTMLNAQVTNDANPSYGVNWTVSCGSPSNCGSFSSTYSAGNGSSSYAVSTIYTAPTNVPTGGVVIITASSAAPASSPTNPATAITTVVQAPTIAFSQMPPASLTAGTQAQVIATVTNDVPPGGVTWKLQCNSMEPGGCGAILPYQTASGQMATYTAPPTTAAGVTVTIEAISTADPNVTVSSSGVAITPATALSIAFVTPVPSQLEEAATVNLNAAVSNDSQNEGVDWQLCASGCGYFTIKPAIPAIPATPTTPFQPALPAVTAISVQAWPNGLPIPYTAPITPPSNGVVTITAAAHADPTTTTNATATITSSGAGPALNGTVMSGSQPVVGAAVQLFEAGTTGYGSAAHALISPNSASSVVTDNYGNFTIPAGYSCVQPTSQVYVVAIGGSVGTNQPNSDLAMMTALGPCGNLNSQAFFVNEVTTVASVWPLAPFAANDPLTGKTSYQYLGSSSSNLAGLNDAFAAVNNLVDVTTGQARFVVPVGNAVVPYVEINTLADILNACTSTSGGSEGDESPCGDLLADSDPLSYNALFQSTAPKDTLQAAFNIAQHPRQGFGYNINVGYDQAPSLFSLASLASPFQPILSAAPNDWSLSLNFTGGGGLTPSSIAKYFAIDALDNLWITDSNAGSLIEWNNQGAALSPSTGFAAGGGPMTIDASGNIWISGNNNLAELTNLGAAYPWSPYTGIAGGGADMAFDAGGNLWIGNGAGVAEFNDLGVELSPTGGYVNTGVNGIGPVVVDSSNNVWVGGTTLAELSDASGQLIVNAQVGLNGSAQMAADGSGRVWIPNPVGGSGFCEVQPADTLLLYQANCPFGGPGGGGSSAFGTIYNPQGVAVDGAGYVWIANQGSTSLGILPNLTEIDAADLNDDLYVGLQSSSLSAGSERVAVDRAGNVWVLLANDTITEFVGVATPAVTPIALAVQNKTLGAKP
jgi:hypothetical protein